MHNKAANAKSLDSSEYPDPVGQRRDAHLLQCIMVQFQQRRSSDTVLYSFVLDIRVGMYIMLLHFMLPLLYKGKHKREKEKRIERKREKERERERERKGERKREREKERDIPTKRLS
jgi:hypothetical protein